MRYIRFRHQDTIRYGIIEGEVVHPLEGSPFSSYTVERDTLALSEVTLLSPCVPTKGVCLGLNYRDHAEEMHQQLPAEPIVFIKPSGCVIGPGEAIIYPPQSRQVDFEAELAIVIGREAKQVEQEEAFQYILGYTCANDVTARDLQPQNGQWTISKGFDTFMPLGPVITDEVDPNNLAIVSRLNGKVRQQSNTRNLIFNCAYLVSYISHVMTLYPQDVILTGTPSGVGPMENGDVIEVEIEGIGILRNTVVKRS